MQPMKLTHFSLTFARVCVVLAMFSVSISTAATNIFGALSLLGWLFSGQIRHTFTIVRTESVAFIAVLLFAALALSMTYSMAEPSVQIHTLSAARKLLLLPVFIVLFESAHTRFWGVLAFVASSFLVLMGSYAQIFGLTFFNPIIKAPGTNYDVFKLYLTQNWLMAYFFFICMMIGLLARMHVLKVAAYIAALLTAINVLGFVGGRTGQLGLLLLAGVWFFLAFRQQKNRPRKLSMMGLIAVMLVAAATLVNTHSALKTRLTLVISELRTELKTQGAPEAASTLTSTGLRYWFYRNGITLMQAQPWRGYGVGSIQTAYLPLTEGKIGNAAQTTTHFHNEYLNFGVQLGVPGLLLFLALLGSLAQRAWRCERHEFQALGVGLALFIALTSLFTSPLFDFSEGHFIALMTGLVVGGIRSYQRPEPH